jgi:phospholipid-binding lipoprotein MlaA
MFQKVPLVALLTSMIVLLGACAAAQKESGRTAPGSGSAPSFSAPNVAEAGSPQERPDPFEPFNRPMLTFNRKADDWVLHPVAQGYAYLVPQPARVSVAHFFGNVGVVPRFANALFQGRFNQAGVEAARFGVNSTVGVAGFFDPAEKWLGLRQESNDFGLTLAKYGVGEGPYLVLPIFGPSTLRDALGKVADGAMNPGRWLIPGGAGLYEFSATAVGAINARSMHPMSFEDLDRYSIDFYGAVQDAYLERRQQQENRVRAGEPTGGPAMPGPEIE